MKRETSSTECALFGSLSGSVAAVVTSPIDVAKTRMMTAHLSERQMTMTQTLSAVFKEQGIRGLFRGIVPRVTWIGLGGAVFLGGYETAKRQLIKLNLPQASSNDLLKQNG